MRIWSINDGGDGDDWGSTTDSWWIAFFDSMTELMKSMQVRWVRLMTLQARIVVRGWCWNCWWACSSCPNHNSELLNSKNCLFWPAELSSRFHDRISTSRIQLFAKHARSATFGYLCCTKVQFVIAGFLQGNIWGNCQNVKLPWKGIRVPIRTCDLASCWNRVACLSAYVYIYLIIIIYLLYIIRYLHPSIYRDLNWTPSIHFVWNCMPLFVG